MHDFGAGDTLEIARAEGQPVMVPFTRAAVPVVDVAAGRCRDRPAAEGLLDPRAEAPGRSRGMTWRATVLTIFPEMLPGPLGHSLAGKALREGLWRLDTVDIRDFATDRHRSVDDAPFGGGPGMVMRPDVLDAAIAGADGAAPLILLSPRGRPLDQARVRALAAGPGVTLICGRFEGVDERVHRGARRSRRSASAISCCRAASRRRSR